VSTSHATISDQPLKPACQHCQTQGEPLEPLPGMETTQSYGSRGHNSTRVGNNYLGREPWSSELSSHASARPCGHYRFHLTGKPRL
jgi:hypothetical protein